MKKYIKPEIVEVKLGEEIMFVGQSSTSLNYDNAEPENAFESGCAKQNNPSFNIWGDDED